MSEKTRQLAAQTLAQPDSALMNYLDTLLAEIDTLEDSSPRQAVKEPTPQADTFIEEAVSIETAVPVADRTEEVIGSAAATSPAPPWAETPFQVLRFSINGVNMVVPLLKLAGIIPLDRPISHLPGQPAWSLGVTMNHETKVVVVDTPRLLMPDGEFGQAAYTHLLLIGEGDRGLAVDGLGGTVTIDKEEIRWRGDVAQHPWYGGILVEELSVLLDVEGVMALVV
jgi:chemotaxis signal transduction protein